MHTRARDQLAVREDLYTTMRDLSAKTVPNTIPTCEHCVLLRDSQLQTLVNITRC